MSAKLDTHVEQGIVKAYEGGMRFMAIVRRYKIGTTTLARILKRNPVLRPVINKLDVRRKLCVWQESAVITWYKAGLTAQKISGRLGCSEWVIRATLSRYQVKHRRTGPQQVNNTARARIATSVRARWSDPKYRAEHIQQVIDIGFKPSKAHRGWRHGKTRWRSRKAGTIANRRFRESVLARDSYKCQECNSTSSLHVHHVIPVRVAHHLIFDTGNGITLCRRCHMKEEARLRRTNHIYKFRDVLPVTLEVK